jgi:hypothetical protein
MPDDAKPDYGNPTIKPDTSTDKVKDCSGAPDMTLCDVVTMPDRWYDVCVAGVCVSPGCGTASCNTPGPHFRIPPFEGHVYLEKQPGDEPVTIDKITGLHWTSCAAGLSGADCDAGMARVMMPDEALAYCDGLSWGGHDDWYLPDIYELTSIADLTADGSHTTMGSKDFLSDLAFPNQQAVSDAFYWSTTVVGGRTVVFSTGQNEGSYPAIVWDPSFPPYPVLCVRRGFSGAMPAGARYVPHDHVEGGQPWTEDRVTGLVFQACSSSPDGTCSGAYTHPDGVTHCRDLVWGGASDWRLPTYKELQAQYDTIHGGGAEQTLHAEDFGNIEGPYVLAAPDGLLDITDMTRTGIGIPDKTYPVLCARGPYAP